MKHEGTQQMVETREMRMGPVRVPVMMQKKVAAELADYLLTLGTSEYDRAMEEIIRQGIDATRRRGR